MSRTSLACVLATCLAAFSGCGGSGNGSSGGGKTAVTVTITDPITSVNSGSVPVTLNAEVQGDPSGAGVSWSLLDSNGAACPSACGVLQPAASPSLSAQYTPPLLLPSPPAQRQPNIVATSVSNPSASASDKFSIAPGQSVSIFIDNKIPSIEIGASTFDFDSTVFDPSSGGISVSLTAGNSSVSCAPACGQLGTVTACCAGSGTTDYSVPYTPPDSVPADPDNLPTLTMTSLTNRAVSNSITFAVVPVGGNACVGGTVSFELAGQWAFLFRGFLDGIPTDIAGNFLTNGYGGMTSGIVDENEAGSPPQTNQPVVISNSFYSWVNEFGCLQLSTAAGTSVYHYLLTTDNNTNITRGELIAFEDQTGTGLRGTGFLRSQLPSSASAGGYSFGMSGWDVAGGHVGIAGHLQTDGSGAVSSGLFDLNDAGTLTAQGQISSGSYSLAESGRGTISFSGAGGTALHAVAYPSTSSEIILMSTDQVDGNHPLLGGEMFSSGTSFSSSTMQGVYLLQTTGFSVANNAPDASIATLGFDCSGGLTGKWWKNDGVNLNQPPQMIATGTYSVDPTSGRTTIGNVGANPPVLYVFPANNPPINGTSAFIVGIDASAYSGTAEIQEPGGFLYNNFTLSLGVCADEEDASYQMTNQVGECNFDEGGQVEFIVDTSGPGGLQTAQETSENYTINSDGSGTIGASSVFVTNANHLFLLDLSAVLPHVVDTEFAGF